MSFYLYFNLIIILFPLIFSFERRLKFYSKFKPLLTTILLVGFIFVGWDVLATQRGHWMFNPSYISDIRLINLPLEEILFFISVPYSCLFLFEAIRNFLGDTTLFTAKKWVSSGIGILIAALAFGVLHQEYTFLAILSVGLTVLFVSLVNVHIFSSRAYWTYIVVTQVLFLIFNYILTSLPVVEYSALAICNLRIATIPIEDFLFNFSMLTMYLTTYVWMVSAQRQK